MRRGGVNFLIRLGEFQAIDLSAMSRTGKSYPVEHSPPERSVPHVSGTGMIKIVARTFLGVVVGARCRWFDVPLPGPPKLVGAFLIVPITFGYLATDKLIATKFPSKDLTLIRDLCGVSNGEVISKRVC